MQKQFDLVAVVGEKQDGKKIYQNVGAVFTRDDGTQCAKISSLPVGGTWNGWLNFYEPRNAQGNQSQSQGYSQNNGQNSQQGNQQNNGNYDDMSDSIPF